MPIKTSRKVSELVFLSWFEIKQATLNLQLPTYRINQSTHETRHKQLHNFHQRGLNDEKLILR